MIYTNKIIPIVVMKNVTELGFDQLGARELVNKT